MRRSRGIVLLVLVLVCLLGVANGGGYYRRKLGGFSSGLKALSHWQSWSGKYAKATRKGPLYRAQRPVRKMRMKTKYHKIPTTKLKRHVRTQRATRGLGSRIWNAFNKFRGRRARNPYFA